SRHAEGRCGCLVNRPRIRPDRRGVFPSRVFFRDAPRLDFIQPLLGSAHRLSLLLYSRPPGIHPFFVAGDFSLSFLSEVWPLTSFDWMIDWPGPIWLANALNQRRSGPGSPVPAPFPRS